MRSLRAVLGFVASVVCSIGLLAGCGGSDGPATATLANAAARLTAAGTPASYVPAPQTCPALPGGAPRAGPIASAATHVSGYLVCGTFTAAAGRATFQCPRPAGYVGPSRLLVYNGNPDGTARASSVEVRVNGREILGEDEFDQKTPAAQAPVVLGLANAIQVRVEGRRATVRLQVVDEGQTCSILHPALVSRANSPFSTAFPATNAFPVPEFQLFNGVPAGTRRVNKGSISLNGKTLLGPKAFHPKMSAFLEAVSVQSSNRIAATAGNGRGDHDRDHDRNEAQYSLQIVDRDKTPPAFSIRTPSDASFTNQRQLVVAGAIDDPSARLTVAGALATLDAGRYTGSASLAECWNTVVVHAADVCGNASEASVRVGLDTVPPVLVLTAPPNGLVTNRAQQTVTLRYSDNFSGIDLSALHLQIDGAEATSSLATGPDAATLTRTFAEGARLVQARVADRAGNVTSTQVGYDASGNVTSVIPPGRPTHSFAYTPADLEQSYTPPSLGFPGSTQTTYNLDQQPALVSRPDGDAVSPTYDSAGRLASLTTAAGTTSYAYSATGQLSQVTAPDLGRLSYSYDGALLTDTTWSGTVSGTVHRTFDSQFRLASESVLGGPPVTYQYDADGLLTAAGALQIQRDPATGFQTGATLGGIAESRTYDAYGAEASYTSSFAGSNLYSVTYSRDALGRISSKTERVGAEPAHTFSYAYDMAGRLTDVSKDGTPTSHYTYDANGNRTAGHGLTTPPVYDAQDRLLSYGACSYTYKPSGELQTKTCPNGTTTYDYDAFGNLRHVGLPNSTQIDYVIDAQNRRIGKKVNGILVEGFLYGSQLKPAGWLDGTGAVKTIFVYGRHANVPEYMIKGGTNYRLITDQVGSVRLVENTLTGAVAERIDYDEFGTVLNDNAPGIQPFGFAGGLRDADTGLTRLGARDYDSVTGRWAAKDPLRFKGRLLNLYGYVGNDPINRNDGSGLLFGGLVDAGEGYGEDAAQWWADQYNASTGWAAVGYAIGGGFAALWTPCTSDKTAATLMGALTGRIIGPFSPKGLGRVGRLRKYIRFDPPHHDKDNFHWDGEWVKKIRDADGATDEDTPDRFDSEGGDE